MIQTLTNIHTFPQFPAGKHEIISARTTHYDPNELAIYQSLSVTRRLNNSKFPVYLVFSKITKQRYAMKVFQFNEDKPSPNFYNEIRFSVLKHPNIVNFVYWEKERVTIHKGVSSKSSYILSEYAPHGDFFGFILGHKAQIDEKLARTYFKQLIAGIEYLHENGVAHLDLKPENLLLGDDYNLKIIDFDLSYVQNDSEILSHGTKRHRAPDFFRSTKVESKSVFPADIYSAGVILFLLKSGGFYPHAEDDGPDNGKFSDLMYSDNKLFWERHSKMENKKSDFYDKNFRELFNGMVKEKTDERWTIKQIKKSKWYNGPVYSPSELANRMKEILEP